MNLSDGAGVSGITPVNFGKSEPKRSQEKSDVKNETPKEKETRLMKEMMMWTKRVYHIKKKLKMRVAQIRRSKGQDGTVGGDMDDEDDITEDVEDIEMYDEEEYGDLCGKDGQDNEKVKKEFKVDANDSGNVNAFST